MITIENDGAIRKIVSALDDIEDEIEKAIDDEDYEACAEWCDARVVWSEELYRELKATLEESE